MGPEGFQIKGKLYDRLKFLVQIVLPALTTLYLTVGSLWDFPEPEKVAGTLSAIAFFLGALIGISARNYKNSEARMDGEVFVTPNEEGTLFTFRVDPNEIVGKQEITLKVGGPLPIDPDL